MARVDPRPASTVVVARPGVEVLAVRRSAISRFAPGFVVFPGGVVDHGDAALAARWFGRVEETARACALRELAEETGLVMTRDGLVAAPGRLPGENGLAPPSPDQVPEMARWIAPEFLPVRFDARFFAIAATRDVAPRPDGVEVEHAWWASPAALLEAASAGEFSLMWPTLRTLQALAECRSVDEVLDLRVAAEPPPGAPFPPGMARP